MYSKTTFVFKMDQLTNLLSQLLSPAVSAQKGRVGDPLELEFPIQTMTEICNYLTHYYILPLHHESTMNARYTATNEDWLTDIGIIVTPGYYPWHYREADFRAESPNCANADVLEELRQIIRAIAAEAIKAFSGTLEKGGEEGKHLLYILERLKAGTIGTEEMDEED